MEHSLLGLLHGQLDGWTGQLLLDDMTITKLTS